jgi:DNA-directed RNA polymerase I, II, and III subunit RPABC2
MPAPKEDFEYSDSGSDSGSESGSEKSGGGGDDYSDGDDIESIMSDLDFAEANEGAEEEEADGEAYEDVEQFSNNGSDDDSDSDDDDDNVDYLQKFSDQLKHNVITEHHPELIVSNFHEVDALCHVVRDADGTIIDPLHTTVPFVTKYEKAKILGERAKQLNAGAVSMVSVNEDIIDGYLIALAEFEQKKIPMIIRRPLPNNASEYWRLQDLEIL